MFDAVALAAVAEELKVKILHGRVQEVVQLDAFTFGFEIYAQQARHYLYLNLHPTDARVHLVSQRLRGSGETPSAFLLLLRKYAQDALVDSVAPLPHERVLQIRVDHSEESLTTLVVETIGRYSNLVLVDVDGTVIDALKRITPTMSRARVTLPRRPYVPPPPQSKLDPSSLAAAELAHDLDKNRGALLRQVLVQTVAGVSPLLAREVAFRVHGDVDASAEPGDAAQVHDSLTSLLRGPWAPSVGFQDGEPAAFAPYPLTQYGESRTFPSISAAIEALYGAPESYAAVKDSLRVRLEEARDKLARKHAALASSVPREGEIERLRTSGELVLAYAWQIKPGQQAVEAETEEGKIEIRLDPKRTPVENAQAYFKEYQRVRDTARRVPKLLEAARGQVEYAEQMLNDLELAENRSDIDAVIQAAHEAGLLVETRPRGRVLPSQPHTLQSRDGLTILVGKNARQNEDVTFRRAKPDDVWLHAQGVAGAHVVIVRAGGEVPESTIQQAAALAAQYSRARGASRVDVIVAPRKDVRRMRGGKTGMVTVRRGRIVQVVQ